MSGEHELPSGEVVAPCWTAQAGWDRSWQAGQKDGEDGQKDRKGEPTIAVLCRVYPCRCSSFFSEAAAGPGIS